MPSRVDKEIKFIPRRDDPVTNNIERDDGSVYLKIVNGTPRLFLNTNDGGVQEISTATPGSSFVSSVVGGSGTNNAVAIWSGVNGDTLDERTEVIIDGTTISSTIPVELGSDPATTGQIRLSNTDIITAKDNVGNNRELLQLSSANLTILGDSSASGEVRALSTMSFRVGGVLRAQVNAGGIYILNNDLQFTDAATAPHVYQTNKLATGTGDTFTVNAQDSPTVGANNVGGELIIRSGDATNGTSTNTGGALTLRSGDGADNNGRVQISSGTTGGTGRVLVWYDESVSDQLELGGNGDGGFTQPNTIRIESNSVVTIGTPSSIWSASASAISWVPPIAQFTATVTSPVIQQASDATGSITGDTLTIHAQDATGATSTGGDIHIRPGSGTSTDGELELQGGDGTVRLIISSVGNVTINSNISVGTSTTSIAGSIVQWGAAASTPILRQADDPGSGATADSMTIRSQDATGGGGAIGGDMNIRPGSGDGSDGNLNLRDGSNNVVINIDPQGDVNFTPTNLTSFSTPIEVDTDSGAVATTGSIRLSGFGNIYFRSQADNADVLALSVDASPRVVVGNGSNIVRLNVGASGVAESTGVFAIRGASTPANSGTLRIPNNQYMRALNNAAGADVDMISVSTTDQVRLGGSNASSVAINNSTLEFISTISSPFINQADETGDGTTADTLTIHAQDHAGTSGTNTAGALLIRAGSVNTSGVNIGGALSIIGGDAAGSLSNTGGAVTIRPGAGSSSNGTLSLQDGGANSRVLISAAGEVTVGGVNGVVVRTGGTAGTYRFAVNTLEVDVVLPLISFRETVSAPIVRQDDDTTNSVTGDTFTVHAQNCTGTSTTGGSLHLRPGTGTSSGGSLELQTGDATARITVDDSLITLGHSFVFFDDALQSTCLLSILPESARDGYDIVVQAQETSLASGTAGTTQILGGLASGSTGLGGDVYVRGGSGSGTNASGGHSYITGGGSNGSGTRGNVAFHTTSTTFGSGEDIMFIGNANTVPGSNPTSGGFLYVESGAGKWRGTSGTITTFGPADPHCPTCGRDTALEWKNESENWELAICMWCVTDALGSIGIIKKEQK